MEENTIGSGSSSPETTRAVLDALQPDTRGPLKKIIDQGMKDLPWLVITTILLLLVLNSTLTVVHYQDYCVKTIHDIIDSSPSLKAQQMLGGFNFENFSINPNAERTS